MRLINEHYQEVDQSTGNYNFFEYDLKEKDMFLVNRVFWYDSEPVIWYTFSIGRRIISLPSHMYLMVGDISSDSVDWIRVEEVPHRNFSTYVFSNYLTPEGWTVEEITLLRVEHDLKSCQLPFSKNVLPILLGDDKAIFVSETDCYKKTKDIPFPNFI